MARGGQEHPLAASPFDHGPQVFGRSCPVASTILLAYEHFKQLNRKARLGANSYGNQPCTAPKHEFRSAAGSAKKIRAFAS
jgi:hypothetical protein